MGEEAGAEAEEGRFRVPWCVFLVLSPCARGFGAEHRYIVRGSDDAHAARRRYKKDLDQIKPDLAEYNRKKEMAMGLAPGTLSRSGNAVASSSSSSAITSFDPSQGGEVRYEGSLLALGTIVDRLVRCLACAHKSAATTGSREPLSRRQQLAVR